MKSLTLYNEDDDAEVCLRPGSLPRGIIITQKRKSASSTDGDDAKRVCSTSGPLPDSDRNAPSLKIVVQPEKVNGVTWVDKRL